ncbi:MAG: tetratricopeptide repeat protein [Pseudomonadota bacterium]
MNPAESTLLSVLSFALLQNARPEKAATLLEALEVLEPGKPRTLRALAIAQIRSGKADKALRTLDKLAMAGGADAAFHLLRAQALAAQERPMEAGVAMKTFLQMRADAAAPAPAAGKKG